MRNRKLTQRLYATHIFLATAAVKYDQLLEIQRASGLRPIKFATLFLLRHHAATLTALEVVVEEKLNLIFR